MSISLQAVEPFRMAFQILLILYSFFLCFSVLIFALILRREFSERFHCESWLKRKAKRKYKSLGRLKDEFFIYRLNLSLSSAETKEKRLDTRKYLQG